MAINFPASRDKLKAKGYTLSGFARANDIDPESFRQLLGGHWRVKDPETAPVAGRAIKAIRDAGCLVEDEEPAAAA